MSEYHNHISKWHLIEHPPSILNAPTFCIHLMLNFFERSGDAHLLPSSTTMLAHAFSTTTKVTKFGRTHSCCVCWNSSNALCYCPLHMSQYHDIPSDHIWRWHLIEHSPSILNAPTFCIHVKVKPIPTNTSESSQLSFICSWTHLTSSRVTMPDTYIQHPHKVNRVWLHILLLHL